MVLFQGFAVAHAPFLFGFVLRVEHQSLSFELEGEEEWLLLLVVHYGGQGAFLEAVL